MILNNCTTCGRKPEIRSPSRYDNYCECKCGKTVISNNQLWTAEVAADMWNRANPVDEERVFYQMNILADKVCKAGLSPAFDKNGNIFFYKTSNKSILTNEKNKWLNIKLKKYKQELTDFYKNRLQPGVKA